MTHSIDAIDRRIISFLQRDGRMSNVDIARAIGVTEATVRKRLDRLIEDGVLRIVGIPTLDRVGLPTETIIMLQVDLQSISAVGARLAAMKEIRSVRYITGEFDLVVEAAFPSDDALLRFLTSHLAAMPGVRGTSTSHVLRTVKSSTDWVLPRDGPPLILVVDDDPDFQEVTRMVLESAGYAVISAANGEQGLQMMRSEAPDLVILDVMMSGVLDGLDASRQMQAESSLRNIPVVMVSSITSSDYAGMFPTDEYVPVDTFMSKPVNPQHLLNEVKRLLA